MPNRKQLARSRNQNMQVRKAPDFRSFYVNWLQGSFSPYDISLAIGQGRTTGPTSFEVEHQANILFSPLEAKVAVAMLGNLIRIFESNFGEVKIPKTMEAQFAAPFPSITAEKKTEGN